jgi:hypothetical protein
MEYTILQSCLLIMQDTMIRANQIKSMKMEEKMYTGQNRISNETQIKCTFKLPNYLQGKKTAGVVQLLRAGSSQYDSQQRHTRPSTPHPD